MNYLKYITNNYRASESIDKAVIEHKPAVQKFQILRAQTGAKVNLFYMSPKKEMSNLDYGVSTYLPQVQVGNETYTDYVSGQQSSSSSANDKITQDEKITKTSTRNDKSAATRAMKYLISMTGMSPEAASGVVGVFMAESGLKPGKHNESEKERFGNRGGRGLGQWTDVGTNPAGQRRTQYELFLNGRTPTLETDLDFFIADLENRPKVKGVLLNPNTTVEDAVDAMHRGYENGTSKAFASKEQMGYTYNKAWEADPKITRKYDFNDEAKKRLRLARQAYDSYYSA